MSYLPTHRATVLPDVHVLTDGTWWDVQNDARCTSFGRTYCHSNVCPRHHPTDYADCMAQHATDSL